MSLVKTVKTMLVAGCAVFGLFYTASISFSKPADPGEDKKSQPAASTKYSPEDYVGSETCQAATQSSSAASQRPLMPSSQKPAGRLRSKAANRVTDRGRPTSRAGVTNQRYGLSRVSHQSKYPNHAYGATPAKKNTTTTNEASTGATT
jgi:hypothetical protein